MELAQSTKDTLLKMAQDQANIKNCSIVVLIWDLKSPEDCAYDFITLSDYKKGMYSDLVPLATLSPQTQLIKKV
jgi:hypothetical protein